MSDLFSNLSMAARALEAQRFGMEVTGQNIANVNTPGYSRRSAEFAAVPPDSSTSAGRGVDVVGVHAARERLLELRLLREMPAQQREAAIADSLAVTETALGPLGESIDARLSAFYDAFSALAESPNSPVTRQAVLSQGQTLAASFNDVAGRLDLASRHTDTQVRSLVDDVNGLASRIAALNDSIASVPENARLHLQDEQALLVRDLASRIDVGVLQNDGGGVDLTFGNGHALVVGSHGYKIDITSSPPDGHAALSTGGADVTTEITGGTLGGLLHVRDVQLPSYRSTLDTLAYDVTQQVNTLHRAGYDQNGTQNRDFFTALTGASGAAAAISVDAALAADPSRLAASGSGAAGDNGAAKSIANLRDNRVLNGGQQTLIDAWSSLVYRVGRDASAANTERNSRNETVRQVDALRDQVSGVSLDEEAMQLLKFQRAYEANARFFSAIDRTIDTLIQTMGR